MCNDLSECFEKLKTDTTKVLAISRSHSLNNPFFYIDDVDYFCFPVSENILIYSTVLMFRKYHHMLLLFNEKIRTVSESGLLEKWQIDSIKSGKRNSDSDQGDTHKKQLKMEHVEGAFLLVLAGSGISIVVFIFEVLFFYFEKKVACKRKALTNRYKLRRVITRWKAKVASKRVKISQKERHFHKGVKSQKIKHKQVYLP